MQWVDGQVVPGPGGLLVLDDYRLSREVLHLLDLPLVELRPGTAIALGCRYGC